MPLPLCNCPKSREFYDHLQYERMLQFLMGLNDNYSQARSQILLMPQLSSVNQAYALVNQDESQKLVAGSSRLIPENMAPTAKFTSRSGYQRPKKPYAPNVFCDYCHIKGHLRADCNKLLKCDDCHKIGNLKANCFRLIGYPPDYKGKREGAVAGNSVYDTGSVNPLNHYPMLQAYVPSVQASIPQQWMIPMPMFTPRQHQQLLRMLEQTSIDETIGSANMTGTFFLPILKWIIDTGASHHMIGDPRYLQHKGLIENARKVQLPTGDSANVSHIGDCHIGRGSLI